MFLSRIRRPRLSLTDAEEDLLIYSLIYSRMG